MDTTPATKPTQDDLPPEKVLTSYFDGNRTVTLVNRWKVGYYEPRMRGAGYWDDAVIVGSREEADAIYATLDERRGRSYRQVTQLERSW